MRRTQVFAAGRREKGPDYGDGRAARSSRAGAGLIDEEGAMARDEGLEELVREHLAALPGVVETTMFGGKAWLLHGNLLCGASGRGLLVRLGPGNDGWALALPDVVPMVSRGRTMRGWVRAGPDGFGDDALRRQLMQAAIAFVRALPAK